jgi:hypothetical protein
MLTPSSALRSMRMIHGIYLLAAVFYAVVAAEARPPIRDLSLVIPIAFGICALSDVAIAVFFRASWMAASERVLQERPGDAKALDRWQKGVLISLTLAESLGLFGLVLKFLGATWTVAGLFIAAAIGLLVAWRPALSAAS